MRSTDRIRARAGRGPVACFVLLAAVALAGCQSVTAVQHDGTFALQVGDRARVNNGDFVLHFVAVPQDSRCPVDVQCVWAGDAAVRVELTSSGRTRQRDLHTNSTVGSVSAEHDGYVVELLDLTPVPRSGQVIEQGDYTARLRLSRT